MRGCERLLATCPVPMVSKSLTAQIPSSHSCDTHGPQGSDPCDLIWRGEVAEASDSAPSSGH